MRSLEEGAVCAAFERALDLSMMEGLDLQAPAGTEKIASWIAEMRNTLSCAASSKLSRTWVRRAYR